MKLLIAIDGSDHALHALRYVIRLAKENGPVSIHLVNAHEEPTHYGELAVYVTLDKMIQLQQQAAALVLQRGEEVLRQAGLSYTKEILIGNVPTSIVQCAEALHCDGIVLGSRGMTAVGSMMMGSVATKVTHLAKLPVTLVK